jgi:carotenoid 1,2-hydratase
MDISAMRHDGPDFSLKVDRNGYAWWYVDALSHDGLHGLTIIAFIGSVFSPYYKWARRHTTADPYQHVAINVALYGPKGRWAMTERNAQSLCCDTDHFCVGPSHMRWENGELIIEVAEYGAPIPLPLRGEIRLRPRVMIASPFDLDPDAQHQWHPIAPFCDVSVTMTHPSLTWHGTGYFDHNYGSEPLESAFTQWDWSRAHSGEETIVHYDAELLSGEHRNLALRLCADGSVEHFSPPPRHEMRSTLWRIDRFVRSDEACPPQIVETLEDAPFYARSTVRQTVAGHELLGFHERLRLDRFCAPIVQMMLPFRMPRITGARAWPRPVERSQDAPLTRSPSQPVS